MLYTGVGKINAAYHLAIKLAEYRAREQPMPPRGNFGTVGSTSFKPGTLVACTSFVQRHMDASPLGFEPRSTPFAETPTILKFESIAPDLPEGICGSGDSFVTAGATTALNVLDMEAYAYAKVFLLQGARFGAIKYITDGADADAADHWNKNLYLAAKLFLKAYEQICARCA